MALVRLSWKAPSSGGLNPNNSADQAENHDNDRALQNHF